jgi:hypothetical protein
MPSAPGRRTTRPPGALGRRAPPLLAQGRSRSSASVRPSPTSVVWCLRLPPTFAPCALPRVHH